MEEQIEYVDYDKEITYSTTISIFRNAIRFGKLKYVLDRIHTIEQCEENDFSLLEMLSNLQYVMRTRFNRLPQDYAIGLHEMKISCWRDILALNLYERKT